jgi:vancomycin resistance protein YoaR
MTSESLPLDAGARGDPAAAAPGSVLVRLAAAFAASVLSAAVLLVALLVAVQLVYADRALPGVRVGGVDLGGLGRAEAAARLEAALPRLSDGTLRLVIGDEVVEVGYEALGRTYDTDAMLERAFRIGRTGTAVEAAIEELRTLVRGADATPLVRWDAQTASGAIRVAARAFDVQAVDATVTRDDAGLFVVTPATYGRRLDRAAALAETHALLDRPDAPSDATVVLTVTPVMPHVLTSQAEYARARAEALAAQDLVVVSGADSWSIPAAEVRSWFSFHRAPSGGLSVEVRGAALEASLKQLVKPVALKPKDAAFLSGKDGQIVGVVPGRNGRALDVLGSVETVSAAFGAWEEGEPPRVELAVTTISPKITTEEASTVAPLMTRLGTWTTYYPPGEGNYDGANISIPAEMINGVVVPAGEWFSFWDTVGIPTPQQGYGPGGMIVDGRSQIGALAGGICSTSTTLFNAALRAGLRMGIRYNHYYYISRYPLGLDATVWISSWTSRGDMTFKNDTGHPILIRARNGYGVVRFDIFGVPDGRKVTFSKPIVKNVVKAVDRVIYTTEIPPGTEKRVEFPHDGMDVWVTRTVTLDGEVIHKDTYYSGYKPVDGELWIGIEPESPDPDPDPSASVVGSTYFV